jgi:hypothetical protein
MFRPNRSQCLKTAEQTIVERRPLLILVERVERGGLCLTESSQRDRIVELLKRLFDRVDPLLHRRAPVLEPTKPTLPPPLGRVEEAVLGVDSPVHLGAGRQVRLQIVHGARARRRGDLTRNVSPVWVRVGTFSQRRGHAPHRDGAARASGAGHDERGDGAHPVLIFWTHAAPIGDRRGAKV